MGTATQIERHGVVDEVDRKLNELLDHARAQPGVNHAILAIERLDQTFRWVGATGDAHPDGPPMSLDTPYWIASVTKLYIAASTFKLIEQNALHLRTPVTELLPAAMIDSLHRHKGVDYSDLITVQHLLGHSSGLPDYLEESSKGTTPLLDAIAENDRAWTIDDAVRIVREDLVPHFPPQDLDARRQKIRYSDTNYQLLIQILEHIHERSLADVFERDFYTPLALTSTGHPGQHGLNHSPATVWAGATALDRPNAMRSFRDLVSTVDDQVRFMRALATGGLFERTDTIYRMMGNWNSFPFSLNPMPKSPVWPISYGLGAMRLAIPRVFTPFTPIPSAMGHTGVSGSWLFYCPDLEVVVAGTVDQFEAAAFPFRFLPRLISTLQDTLKRN